MKNTNPSNDISLMRLIWNILIKPNLHKPYSPNKALQGVCRRRVLSDLSSVYFYPLLRNLCTGRSVKKLTEFHNPCGKLCARGKKKILRPNRRIWLRLLFLVKSVMKLAVWWDNFMLIQESESSVIVKKCVLQNIDY